MPPILARGRVTTITNGVARESPLAPLLIDVYINWIIDQWKKIKPQPSILYIQRIALFSTQKYSNFYQPLNKIYLTVQFTEEASKNQYLF